MHKKDISSSTLLFRPALLALGFALVSMPAQAGFQWISPSAPEQPPVAAPVVSAPSALDALPPAQIIEGKASIPLAAPKQKAAAEPVVEGFANQVPLSIALQQILPEGTGFSVAQDVSLSTLVSWKGGAPWRQVMGDMLSSQGLGFKEQAGLVQVVKGASGTAPVAPMPISPAAGAAKPSAAPVALLPPAQDLPVRIVPDRNMPDGKGGVLGVPSSAAPSSAQAPLSAPAVPPSPSIAPQSLAPMPVASATPLATDTAPYMQDKAVSAWTANKGDTLQSILEDWSKRANVELSWQAEYDYPLQTSVSLSGSFETAVRTLLAGFQEASPQPIGYLYNNQVAGQTVLVVQVRGNSYNE